MYLGDTDRMPFGAHKGMPMQDVPAKYLHWIWHNTSPTSETIKAVHKYIEDNIDALRMEDNDLLWSKRK